jgi:hypothetical protein
MVENLGFADNHRTAINPKKKAHFTGKVSLFLPATVKGRQINDVTAVTPQLAQFDGSRPGPDEQTEQLPPQHSELPGSLSWYTRPGSLRTGLPC